MGLMAGRVLDVDHPECFERLVALRRAGKSHGGRYCVSSEDTEARQQAMQFTGGGVLMALEKPDLDPPLEAENPGPQVTRRKRRTREEIEADKAAAAAEKERARAEKAAAREQAKVDAKLAKEREKAEAKARRAAESAALKIRRAQERIEAKAAEKAAKIAEAEGGRIALPALVFRSGQVRTATMPECWKAIGLYLDDLMLDCENSGYPLGHQLYELRTVQVGGEEVAVVFDAADAQQMQVASLALTEAKRIRAHSATADAIPVVVAGLIGWDDLWAKMYDSVLSAKLTDPKMSGSDANALKELAADILGNYAVAPEAEKAKNELFRAMGCLTETDLLTPPERNGWHQVSRFAVTMIRYAGSDVLDLAAVIRCLPPLPVSEAVLDREREFQAACAPVTYVGFALDPAHIKVKIAEEEAARAEAQRRTQILSLGKITNPKSPDVIKLLPEILPGVELGVDRKTKRPSANKGSLEKIARSDDPAVHWLCKSILDYRHHDTTLGLLLRPLENLCEHGDGRMRPTVYTIEAVTGRTSCRRPNGQQFSRQGGVRACVRAGDMYLICIDGRWHYANAQTGSPVPLLGISADFEGCEIRVAAALSGDVGLLRAETESRCYKCEQYFSPADDSWCSCGPEKAHKGLHWMAAHEAFGSQATKEHRYWCKRGIFCKLFGGGPETAAEQVYAPVEPMARIFRAFEGLAPVYTEWDRWLRECYKKGSLVWRDYATGKNYRQDIEGSHRMVYKAYSGRNIYITNGEHAAGNGAIQGTARELLVDGTLRWRQQRWGNLAILPIHDELTCFVPAFEASLASRELAACMQTKILSSPGFEVNIGADFDEPWASWPDSS